MQIHHEIMGEFFHYDVKNISTLLKKVSSSRTFLGLQGLRMMMVSESEPFRSEDACFWQQLVITYQKVKELFEFEAFLQYPFITFSMI